MTFLYRWSNIYVCMIKGRPRRGHSTVILPMTEKFQNVLIYGAD